MPLGPTPTRPTATSSSRTRPRRPPCRCSRSTTTTFAARTAPRWVRSTRSTSSTCARAAFPSRPRSGCSSRASSATCSTASRSSTRASWSRRSWSPALASYRVASVDDLPGETMKRVEAGDIPVCLAHAEDGSFYALNDVCTHEEFSLCDGELWGMDVECPQHGSRFNLATGIAYLDSANTSQRPKQMTGAMLDYFEKFNSNIHRAAYRIAEEATVRYEATREKVRTFINAASTKEIVYTRGTTEAINLVAYAWGRKNIKAGDLIVLTILDHHSNIVPWQILAAEKGARIEYVDIDERGELRQDQFADLLKRGPKLVAFNLVSNAMGTINPAHEMVAAAKKAGATVLVDGAQSTPHQPVDVRALGCDFYAFSGHKMLGPTGAGILYGRRELLEAMDPFMSGGDMIKTVRVEGTTYHDLPWKFEAGTQAIAEVIGLGTAVDYLTELGMDAVRAHELEITEYAYEALSEVDQLTVYGPPPSRRAGVISFALEGVHPHDLATIADRDQVCLRAGHHCAMPLMTRLGIPATARASFYVYTQKEEVDRLVGSIREAQRIFA